MKYITLTGKRGEGKFAIVDDEDYERCVTRKWNLHCKGYAIGSFANKMVLMQCFIMNFPSSGIDHINRIKLDNRKENLRLATGTENNVNSIKKYTNKSTSIYKGVYFNKKHKRWYSQIRINKKQTYLGNFSNEIEAAKAYDIVAIETFGEFACTNFPRTDYE